MKAAGHQILFELREKAGLKRAERDPKHEEKYIFMPTQKAFEKAVKDNREGIELLRILSGRGEPAEDAAFLATLIIKGAGSMMHLQAGRSQ